MKNQNGPRGAALAAARILRASSGETLKVIATMAYDGLTGSGGSQETGGLRHHTAI